MWHELGLRGLSVSTISIIRWNGKYVAVVGMLMLHFSPSSLGTVQLGHCAGCSQQCLCRVAPGPIKATRGSAQLLLLESCLDLCVV